MRMLLILSGTTIMALTATAWIHGSLDAAPAQPAGASEAEQKFLEWTRYAPPAGEVAKFVLNVDFPTVKPAPRAMPWDAIDYEAEPARYLRSVLDYCIDDAEARDFQFGGSTRWYHAPWLAREPLRGLTNERGSEPGELAAGSGRASNAAVGYYNDLGAWAFSKVWANRGDPQPMAVDFPVGTVSCKLLFTDADPAVVEYLKGSLEWRAAPRGGPAKTMRLLQFDVAVRDQRADAMTGWLFGTFMFLGDPDLPRPFSFSDLTPVGLMWGNDPDLGPIKARSGARPKQGWVNPVAAEHYRTIRSQTPGMSTELGLFGRMNGPVDNPSSSCLACHGRALDGGVNWTPTERSRRLPFVPPSFDASNLSAQQDAAVRRFFRNLKHDEPFLAGKQSLDYSLQLAVGLENYHAWRKAVASLSTLGAAPDAKTARERSWIDLVPDAEEPKRGDTEAEMRERRR